MTGKPAPANKLPNLRVKPRSYQPTKADMAKDVSIDATPDELAEAVLRPVRMVEDENA